MDLNRSQLFLLPRKNFSIVIRKSLRVISFSYDLLIFCLAIPVAIFICIISNWKTIRIIPLDMGRIGATYNAAWYLAVKAKAKDFFSAKYVDVFYIYSATGVVANHAWLRLWKRHLRILPFGKFWSIVLKICKSLTDQKKHTLTLPSLVNMSPKNDFDSLLYKTVLARNQPNVCLTNEEVKQCKFYLKEMGLAESNEFICFHARDSLYLDKIDPSKSWTYHDYRDSAIKNYLLAADYLTKQSYFSIRVGSVVKEPIDTSNSRIIDYALSHWQCGLMDIYLGANCKFLICSDTGLSIFSEIFCRPIVFVNWSLLNRLSDFNNNAIFIPKKMYSTKLKKVISFSDIINSDLGRISDGKVFLERGIVLQENTPEEILAVAFEMERRLQGAWQETEEDQQLQEKFWSLYPNTKIRNPTFRIGADYLRKNKHLLD